jgi:hypothetical protein
VLLYPRFARAKGNRPIFVDMTIGIVPMVSADSNLHATEEFVMPKTCKKPIDDPWDAFELEDDAMDLEPEPGDFWGELNDDSDSLD